MSSGGDVLVERIQEHFGGLDDPRIERTRHHPLINILVMTLCGAMAGADGWDELAGFAKSRASWFADFLDMPHGTPSADTFRRVLCALRPREFEACFRGFVNAMGQSLRGEVVAIDGKALRGAVHHASSKGPLYLLHVWATEQHLLLGQRAVAGAPGEVGAIPEMLRLLNLEGAIVTTDANGCTAAVTAAVREAKADYVLALKGNRGPLHKHVRQSFEQASQTGFKDVPTHRTEESGHGRIETRTVRVIPLENAPIKPQSGWTELRTAAFIERTRTDRAGKTKTEHHYYLSSLGQDAARIAHAVRAHWGIENHLHRTLDVAFDEDRRKICDDIGAQNFALVTRIALMLIKRDVSKKASVRMKRRLAGWDNAFLVEALVSGLSQGEI